MKKLKLSLQNIEGVEVFTRAQLKMVMGGDCGSGGVEQRYQCTCIGGIGQWQYSGSSTPSSSTTGGDIARYCSSGNANCGWVTCGNPGVTC